MIRVYLIPFLLLCTAASSLPVDAAPPPAAEAPAPADAEAIRAVALDYIEGYYEGDRARVESSLHPDLAKRRVETQNGRSRLVTMTPAQLLSHASSGSGKRTPKDQRGIEVRVLDVFHDAATVRVDAHGWVDYMHIARWNGEWKVVNVLWELRRSGRRNDR